MAKLKRGEVIKQDTGEKFLLVDGRDELFVSLKDFYQHYSLYDTKKTRDKPWQSVTGYFDGYKFSVFGNGSKRIAVAGCHVFRTLKAAQYHWDNSGEGYYGLDDLNDWRIRANTRRLNKMTTLFKKLKEKM